MEAIVDFLVKNYMWFLVLTIFLVFALIGYIVELREYNKANVRGGVSKELEKSFERLAASAQNQTLGDALSRANQNFAPQNNQIMPNNIDNQQAAMNVVNTPVNPQTNTQNVNQTFQILNK